MMIVDYSLLLKITQPDETREEKKTMRITVYQKESLVVRYNHVEIFHFDPKTDEPIETESGTLTRKGWYAWTCFDGCLPDSDARGPFRSYDAAVKSEFEDIFCGITDEEILDMYPAVFDR